MKEPESKMKRRTFLSNVMAAGGAAGMSSAILSSCSTKGSELSVSRAGGKIKIGFIPLTDCASVVMAHELGLYKKHGVNVVVEKQASWPVVRDKLASGELQGAHCLF